MHRTDWHWEIGLYSGHCLVEVRLLVLDSWKEEHWELDYSMVALKSLDSLSAVGHIRPLHSPFVRVRWVDRLVHPQRHLYRHYHHYYHSLHCRHQFLHCQPHRFQPHHCPFHSTSYKRDTFVALHPPNYYRAVVLVVDDAVPRLRSVPSDTELPLGHTSRRCHIRARVVYQQRQHTLDRCVGTDSWPAPDLIR